VGRPGPVQVTLGPLCRSVDDVVLIMKALWTETMFQGDPTVPRMSFDEKMFEQTQKPCSVGYFDSLDLFPTSVAMRRAVKMAADALEQKGYKVTPLVLTQEEQLELYELFVTYAVNYDFISMMLESDKQYERRHKMYQDVWIIRLRNWQKSILGAVLKGVGMRRLGFVMDHSKIKTQE